MEDLIAVKPFAGGPQDLEDARGIMLVSGAAPNHELRTVVPRYGSDPAELSKLFFEILQWAFRL